MEEGFCAGGAVADVALGYVEVGGEGGLGDAFGEEEGGEFGGGVGDCGGVSGAEEGRGGGYGRAVHS